MRRRLCIGAPSQEKVLWTYLPKLEHNTCHWLKTQYNSWSGLINWLPARYKFGRKSFSHKLLIVKSTVFSNYFIFILFTGLFTLIGLRLGTRVVRSILNGRISPWINILVYQPLGPFMWHGRSNEYWPFSTLFKSRWSTGMMPIFICFAIQ